MTTPTYGDLRRALAAEGLHWSVNPAAPDEASIPRPHLGAIASEIARASDLPQVDVAQKVAAFPPTNAFLADYLIKAKILKRPLVAAPLGTPPQMIVPGANLGGSGGPPVRAVDWRNRWGINWITQIRDQDPCEACWAFGATALVEAMVRIEHCVWCPRSEADVHDGMGKKCGDCGNPGAALDWIKNNGLADPLCYNWPDPNARTSPYFNPPPNTCLGSANYNGSTVAPNYVQCSNRSGRTVRIGSHTDLGNVNDQKNWLEQVGPLVVCMDIYNDFFGWHGNSPYVLSQWAKNQGSVGSHIMLAVGFDNHLNCWIVKNSWGATFGNQGYCLIGYGECNIDGYGKTGLQDVNPDPWTKRRLHGGAMIESGNGATHRNFELLSPAHGNQIAHWWRDNTVAGFPWARAEVFGNDAAACPTLTSSTYNRNFESIHLTTSHRLHHWWFDQVGHQWRDGGIFGPSDAAGIPGFIESTYGPGNFELVVRTADGKLNHWWRDNHFVWHDGGRFGSGVALSGATLVQSSFGQPGNFELICVLNNGQMQHWWRDSSFAWHAGVTFGGNISSPPCMIQGQYAMPNEFSNGNFELCVATPAGTVQHWWRDNSGSLLWHMSATFGHNVQAVVSLLEGSFGFNLEVVVLRKDGQLQHYWRDGAGWHEGVIIGTTL